MCPRARIYALYGRSVRAGVDHLFSILVGDWIPLVGCGISGCRRPFSRLMVRLRLGFFGGPAFGVNLLARAALVRFVRYGMVSPTLVVLIDGLPVPFQAWTR